MTAIVVSNADAKRAAAEAHLDMARKLGFVRLSIGPSEIDFLLLFLEKIGVIKLTE